MNTILSNDCLATLLAAHTQIKVWHWQTRNPEHEILGELYDAYGDTLDTLVEAMLGAQGSRALPLPAVMRCTAFTNVGNTIDKLKGLRTFLQTDLTREIPAKATDLLQLRDTLIEHVDKAIYKLLPQ